MFVLARLEGQFIPLRPLAILQRPASLAGKGKRPRLTVLYPYRAHHRQQRLTAWLPGKHLAGEVGNHRHQRLTTSHLILIVYYDIVLQDEAELREVARETRNSIRIKHEQRIAASRKIYGERLKFFRN